MFGDLKSTAWWDRVAGEDYVESVDFHVSYYLGRMVFNRGCLICFMRLLCLLSFRNSVLRNMSIISFAISGFVQRAPRQSICALLCLRARYACCGYSIVWLAVLYVY